MTLKTKSILKKVLAYGLMSVTLMLIYFVVAAECKDMQTAEDICNKLESNGIKAMIVEKDSPVYIKGNGSPVQIQVCRKDHEKAKKIQQ